MDFFEELNKNDIQYCVLEYDAENQYVDMFVHPNDNKKYLKLLKHLNYKEITPPMREYAFIYRLKPDVSYISPEGVTIHSACQMSCVSLSNLSKCKLPLDNSIQESLWKNKIWDAEHKYWKICLEDHLIQILTKCVFNQKEFDKQSTQWIEECGVDLDNAELVQKLEGVFFFFTPELILHIKEKRFDKIIYDYRTFRNY